MNKKQKKWTSPKMQKLAVFKTEGGSYPKANEGEQKILNLHLLEGSRISGQSS